jgi:uncharacterized protein involved in exopolysaccharide biosynthesis
MAITPTIGELEDRLEAIDAQIAELLTVPLEGQVGRTRIGLKGNLEELRRQRAQILGQIRAAKIRQGQLRPASREVY